jgi:hypothetical protein
MAARYVLVPSDDPAPPPVPGLARLRRFRLARVGVTPRSALGCDRYERLERVAEQERRSGPSANGSR